MHRSCNATFLETSARYNEERDGVRNGTMEKGQPLKVRLYQQLVQQVTVPKTTPALNKLPNASPPPSSGSTSPVFAAAIARLKMWRGLGFWLHAPPPMKPAACSRLVGWPCVPSPMEQKSARTILATRSQTGAADMFQVGKSSTSYHCLARLCLLDWSSLVIDHCKQLWTSVNYQLIFNSQLIMLILYNTC